jgi:hypothetical protein
VRGVAWAVALLIEAHNQVWASLLQAARQRREERERMDRARAQLCEQLGLASWEQVRAAAGRPVGAHLQYPPVAGKFLTSAIVTARFALYDDVSQMFGVRTQGDKLQQAEDSLWGSTRSVLSSGLHCPTTGTLLGVSFLMDYSFTTMAADQIAAADKALSGILRAAWTIAQSAGAWWPFEHVAVLSDRPAELHLNEQGQLHRAGGPAAVYRDGWRAFAWAGKAMPERWILEPASIARGELKHLDASFRAHVAERVGPATARPARKPKPSTIFSGKLPIDGAERLEKLREQAGGRLVFFERYTAGEHEKVWTELVALGAGVRQDPQAPDALAVAYETMRRVAVNIRTVIDRLNAMSYRFRTDAAAADEWVERADRAASIDVDRFEGLAKLSPVLSLFEAVKRARDMLAGQVSRAKQRPRDESVRAHVPPHSNVQKTLASFERRVGILPISLRAFYEIVGAVNLLGRHTNLAPPDGTVAPDPLLVYGVEDALANAESEDDDDEQSRVVIAPDDLHKADTSGGDPYEIMVPEPRADGELLNERHHLLFVDYLRLAFRFGGFPGYEGIDTGVPAEIETLRTGLLDF